MALSIYSEGNNMSQVNRREFFSQSQKAGLGVAVGITCGCPRAGSGQVAR